MPRTITFNHGPVRYWCDRIHRRFGNVVRWPGMVRGRGPMARTSWSQYGVEGRKNKGVSIFFRDITISQQSLTRRGLLPLCCESFAFESGQSTGGSPLRPPTRAGEALPLNCEGNFTHIYQALPFLVSYIRRVYRNVYTSSRIDTPSNL